MKAIFKSAALAVVLLLLLFNPGCKKYEDGPLISFRTPMDRLWGVWEVEYFSINGEDHTQEYRDSCNRSFLFWYYSYPRMWFINGLSSSDNISADYFDLINHDTDLFVEFRYGTAVWYEFLQSPSEVQWDIKKLTNNKLWMESESVSFQNNVQYYIKLKKIKDEDY